MNDHLGQKLKNLPSSPGVYFHKDIRGEIIYVGKAAVLKNRVRQYFQSKKDIDAKTQALVEEIDDTDWVETESELDALFLESEMVKRYMPRYNILLRDDKSQIFVRIDIKSLWPTVTFTRNPMDDGAEYYGPFFNGFAVKKALRYLRRVFPYYTKPRGQGRDLDTHLGLNPSDDTTSAEYKKILRKLVRYIEGGRLDIVKSLEKEMRNLADKRDFEAAAVIRNKLRYLRELQSRIMFGDKEFLDISKDVALGDLSELLSLNNIPRRIEGFDISHMSGTNVVASMVVFNNGVSDRAEYRKFKTRHEQNNDFDNMRETINRRLSAKNRQSWGTPDLILIDGGKGQLDAAMRAQRELGLEIPMIGLAKKQEQIVVINDHQQVKFSLSKLNQLEGRAVYSEGFTLIDLPNSSHIIKLLQRIRDESHRFAVSYHTQLKVKRQTASLFDDIPGVGPVTRRKLIKHFGSVRRIGDADEADIVAVVGPRVASKIVGYFSKS